MWACLLDPGLLVLHNENFRQQLFTESAGDTQLIINGDTHEQNILSLQGKGIQSGVMVVLYCLTFTGMYENMCSNSHNF